MKKEIIKRLEERGVVVLLGMYGMGKGRVVEGLVNEVGGRVVRVSVKDLPVPSEDDIPEICGYSSWARLHSGWRKLVGKRGKKLIIVIEGVEQLLPSGDRLWEILTSLLYYQKGKVKVILSGTASVVDAADVNLRRLVRGNVIWMKAMDEEEVRGVVQEHENSLGYSLMQYESGIGRIAHGHYGTVKYLCQLIAENKYEGEKLSESRVIGWAGERGDLEYFVRRVWEGYSSSQQRVVRRFLTERGRIGSCDKKTVDELVKSGLLYRGGRDLKWRVKWVEKVVRKYVAGLPVEKRGELSEEELGELGVKERAVVEVLWKKRGKVMSADELGDVIVGEGESYSRWAVAQIVGRVRNKLREIAPEMVIETVRGVGYRWV